jgi:hypothetical protein
MKRSELLLIQLVEECNEVAQRASKCLRFGSDRTQPYKFNSNAERLNQEFIDLLTIHDMLVEEGVIPKLQNLEEQKENKKRRVEEHIEISEELGISDKETRWAVCLEYIHGAYSVIKGPCRNLTDILEYNNTLDEEDFGPCVIMRFDTDRQETIEYIWQNGQWTKV